MKFIRLTVTAALVATSFASFADENPVIAKRQDAMMSLGKAMKTLTPMAKGDAEFDPDLAAEAIMKMNAVANEMASMFPEDSKTGMGHSHDGKLKETEVAPKIWDDPAGFQAEIDSFIASTSAAASNPPSDLFDLEETMGSLGKHCKSCHQDYRIKKD